MQLKQGQLDALADFVKALQVANGKPTYDNRESRLAFEKKILIAEPWKALIGPREFEDILWDSVWNGALGFIEYTDVDDFRLDDPQYVTLFERIFNNVRRAFESLPRAYDVYLPLTGFPELGASVVPVVPGVDLVDSTFDEELAKRMNEVHPKFRSHAAFLLGVDDRAPNEAVKTRYLRIAGQGYGSSAADSPMVRSALSTAKQFISLAVQEGAAYVEPGWRRKWDDQALEHRSAAMLFPKDGSRAMRIDVPAELMGLFHRVILDASKLKVREPSKTFLGLGPERPPATPEEMERALASLLERTRRFLALDADLEDAKRLRSSMEWAIDADTTTNESIAFLQRCIAFEALLGSSERSQQRGVTDRLSDRYAYLLGQTESQRKEERDRFRDMYEHRSDIVHGRAGRLSEKHRKAAADAEVMLSLVLRRETANLLQWHARQK